jgi:TolB-like protein/Tfp pilus assembly protein PilF
LTLLNELKRRNVFRVGAAYTVVSWLIIQVTETIFPLFGYDESLARTIVIVLAIGFIPALIFAWVFELTPEGLKKEKDVDRTRSNTVGTGKKLDRMIMVVLALALGYFAVDKFVLDPARDQSRVETARQEGRSEALAKSSSDKSIAVLSFVDMSSSKDQEYMSDGIAEELLNLLAKIPELRVISRTSAFSYKGKSISLAQIAKELKVAYILEGSVRKSGSQIRITAQLIQTSSDTHLWSETYDRALENIFAIQDDIAAVVVEELKIKIMGAPPVVEKTNPEAFALVLQASHLYRQQTPEAIAQALALFKEAIAIHPDYPRAWTGLARIYQRQVTIGGRSIQESKELALNAIDQALKIDPEFVTAHKLLGWSAMAYDNDLAAAARYYQRALELDPSDFTYIAHFLASLGRLSEAIVIQQETVSRDPVNAYSHYSLGVYRTFNGDLDDALASYRTALKLRPGLVFVNYDIGLIFLLKNEPHLSLAAFTEEMNELARIKGTALALHDLGRKKESDAALNEHQVRVGDTWPSEVAMVYAWIGDKNAAFQWLDKEIEVNGTYGWTQIPEDPHFRNLHDDPRWQALLSRVGVSADQLAAIEFNVE